MKNKEQRLQAILEIISTRHIRCQGDLAGALADKGFAVTQATLSRDLKTLRVTKAATAAGIYIYAAPGNGGNPQTEKSGAGNAVGFISLNFSGNTAVIKTRNGYASGLAYDIDMSRPPEILGTIAGADTIIAILREDVTRAEAEKVFRRFFPADNI